MKNILILFSTFLICSCVPMETSHSGPRFPKDAERISVKTYEKLIDIISTEVNKGKGKGKVKDINISMLEEMNKKLESIIDNLFTQYSTDPVDMKKNKKIYNELQIFSSYFKKINEFYSKEFNPRERITNGAVGEYRNIYFGRTGKYPNKSEFSDYFFAKYPEIQNSFKLSEKLAVKVDKYKKEIYSFGVKYEVERLQKIIEKKYGIKKAKFPVENLLFSLIGSSVKQNKVYNLRGSFKVIQSIKNGVLVQCTDPYYNTSIIFVETNKSYPDGHIFRKHITVISDGYFEYTSILSQNKKVYKFIELELSEKYYFL